MEGLQSIEQHEDAIKNHHKTRKENKSSKEVQRLRMPSTLLEDINNKCEKLGCYQSDIVSYFLNKFLDKALEQEFVGNTPQAVNLEQIASFYNGNKTR